MAYKTITVQTLVNRVKFFLLGVGQTDTVLDTEIQWALNSVLQDMIGRSEFPTFRMEGNLVTSANTEDYWLPDDFDKIVEPSVRFVDTPYYTLRHLSEQDFDDVWGRQVFASTARPEVYNIRWRDQDSGLYLLRFHPVPDAAYAVRYTYISLPTRLDTAALTDTFDKRFPPQYHEALAYGAATRFPQYLSPTQLVTFNGIYEKAITNMFRSVRPVVGKVAQNEVHRDRVKQGIKGLVIQSLTAPPVE